MLGAEGLHLHFLHLGVNTIIGGIAGDEPLFHRPLERAVEHEVDASDCGAAQSLFKIFSGEEQ